MPKDPNYTNIGDLIRDCFASRKWGPHQYAVVSRRAGLDDQHIERIVKGRRTTVRRGTLLKIAAAMELAPQERRELEVIADHPSGSLQATVAEQIDLEQISMRRAVLLLTAPTDPHTLPFRGKKRREVATRSGVVFGWHDVVVRISTPEDHNVLDYADDLFKSGRLRTIETVPLRDDLPMYVDQDFTDKGLQVGDYYWAVIFVEALGTPRKFELRDVFYRSASTLDFQGGIHLLTAAVAVGRFDTVVEVLAANLLQLQSYVRDTQNLCNKSGQEIHTVTYFALRWRQQKPFGAPF